MTHPRNKMLDMYRLHSKDHMCWK